MNSGHALAWRQCEHALGEAETCSSSETPTAPKTFGFCWRMPTALSHGAQLFLQGT